MVPYLQLLLNPCLIYKVKLILALNVATSSGLPSATFVSISLFLIALYCIVNIIACDSLRKLQNAEAIEIWGELQQNVTRS